MKHHLILFKKNKKLVLYNSLKSIFLIIRIWVTSTHTLLQLRPIFTSGCVEYLKQNEVNIQMSIPFYETFYENFYKKIYKTRKLLINDRLKSLIMKKGEIQIIKHGNGYIQVKVPKSKLLDLISVKQPNLQNCTFKDGSNEKLKQAVSEIEKKNPNDSLEELIKMLEKENTVLEKLDPEVVETDDVLMDTLDELLNLLNSISKALEPWGKIEEENKMKSIIPKTVISKSAEVYLKRQYKKAKLAVKTLDMIKDVMTFPRKASASFKKKFVPLTILLNHKLKYI